MATPARPARSGPSSPPPQTPITDFSALEGQKENIQPLSTGRSAHALSTIFAQRPKQLEKDLKDAQAKFEQELTECEQRRKNELEGGDLEFGESDPLDVFERYIKHIREVAPSGSTQSSILIPLLERCTRTLLAEGDIWAQDFRYVRIWIQYSRLIDRKTEVFDFLLAREVGTDWSALYEEWAVVLEGLGRRSEADKAYRLGLARKAKPVERLQQRYKAFQVRMLTPAPFLPEPSTATSSSSRAPARNALGTISTTAAGLSLSSATPKANNGKRGGLSIFVDGEEDSDKKWEAELGTRDAVRKENEREAVSFKSAEVLPQGRGIAPRTPKLEVFRDETAASTPSAHAVEDVFTRSNTPAQWELIVQDPLANMRALPVPPRSHRTEASAPPPAPTPLTTSTQSYSRSHSSSRPPPSSNPTGYVTAMAKWQVPDSTPPIAKNGKPEVRKFKWDMVFHDEREWSFEECRARSLGIVEGGKDLWAEAAAPPAKAAQPAAPAKASPSLSIFQVAPPPPTPAASRPPQTPSTSIFADPPPAPTPASVSPPARDSVISIAPPAPTPRAVAPTPRSDPTPKAKGRPSPTVNTKAALADVLDMYNAGAGDDSDEEDSDESEDDEEDSFMAGSGGGVQMKAPEQGFIPPTPTPAQGHVQSQIRPSQLFQPAFGAPQEQEEEEPASAGRLDVFADQANESTPAPAPPAAVFRDENAVPSRTPGGPSRTPARTPLSVRKPTFEVFSDADPQPAQPSFSVDQNAAPPSRQSFATPMPESKQPLRRGLGAVSQVMEEEEEDEEGREQDQEDDAAHRSNRPVWDGRVGGFELMTPITERTGEYSNRQSMGARSSMGGRGGILEEEDEEEEEEAGDKAFVAETDPSVVESEAVPAAKDALSPLGAVAAGGREFRDATPEFDSFADRSGRMFGLSDGYTIEGLTGKTADLMDTMHIVDPTGTVDTATTAAVEPELIAQDSPIEAAPPQAAPSPSSPAAPLAASVTPPSAAPSAIPARLQPLPPAAIQSPVRPSVAKAIAASSPVAAARPKPAADIPNPCNPMDPDLMNQLIASLDPPLAALPGFKDFTSTTIDRLDGLQKSAKQKARRGSTGSSKSGVGRDETSFGEISLGGDVYEVKEKIGEGGFGAVFLAKDLTAAGDVTKSTADAGSDDGSDDSDDDDGPSHLVALKVEKPSGIWEGLVLDRVHTRLEPASLRSSIIASKNLYAFKDESYLVLSYSSQGTLLDAVNSAAKLGIASTSSTPGAAGGMDELVVLFFAVELLKIVEGLHRAEIIHGDLKIDNCLVRLEEVPTSEWTAQYDAGGGGGWAKKGVRMIDFGKSIDMSLFPAREKQTFIAEWEVDQRDCVEMREARPWSYQTDYHGLASVFYCMLFGKYIETVAAPTQPGVNTKRYKIATPLKRYWQTDLWTRLFDLLLNPRLAAPTAAGNLPICDDLAAIRTEMAQLVGDKCMKDGKNLRSLLKKLELGSLQGR